MSREDALRAEQLLQSVREAVKPTRADAARNFSGVEARLGFAIGGAAPASAQGHAAPGALQGALGVTPVAGVAGTIRPSAAWQGLQLSGKGALVLAFALATGVAGYFIGRADAERDRDPLALDSAQPPPVRSTPPETAPPATPATLAGTAARVEEPPLASPSSRSPAGLRAHSSHRARATAPVQRATTPVASPTGEHGLDLSEALELLERAEAAVRRSDGLEARIWLSDLDRRAPHALLLEERLVTATLASCALADVADAQRTLQELEQANPESMYRARLEGSCVADFVHGRTRKATRPDTDRR